MTKIKDGWHKAVGRRVYVENGVVVKALTFDGQRTVYPYKVNRGGYDRAEGLTLGALRCRIYRKNIVFR